jgi:hypothetical protein
VKTTRLHFCCIYLIAPRSNTAEKQSKELDLLEFELWT